VWACRTSTRRGPGRVSLFRRNVDRHRPAPPGPRHAVGTEAVVVDHGPVIELHPLEDKAGVAVRTQADSRPDDPLPRDTRGRQVDRGPWRERERPRQWWRRLDHFLGAAAGEAESGERHAAGLEKVPPVHAHPPWEKFE